ncbi:hypothetical protein niasHS_013431 [Heterodera schachtii]|uniref:Nonsense-mediated mRNA decay factor SMG8 n=1 Tax=Heterodera schachtii TaxID=97005 RepID=A0ABD2ICI0_HETSC
MAKNLNSFIENGYLKIKNFGVTIPPVPIVIATLIGKETSDNTKNDIINRYLGKEVFFDWSFDDDSKMEIKAFYDEEETVLWLLFNGIHDISLLHRLFESGENGESFFEKLSGIEAAQHRFLLFLFSISHLVLFVEQACRFDLDLINLLEDVNRNRLRSVSMIKTALFDLLDGHTAQNLPFLRENGRIAVPKMLFCFYRNPLRIDLSNSKKKELLEKMEKCIESQVSHFMRQHGIIDNRFPENALGQITISSGAPFVYIFNHDELPKDANNEFALSLYPEESCEDFSAERIQKLIENVLELHPKNKELLSRSDYNFDYFLHTAILNIRKKIMEDIGTTTFNLNDFVQAAKFLKRMFVDGAADGYSMAFSRHSLQEVDTLNSIIDSSVGFGMNLYKSQLNQQPDVTGGGDIAFSQLEHDFTLNMVIDQLVRRSPRALGKAKQNTMVERIRTDCTALWMDGHQRCETLSLTGQLCHFTLHDLPNETSVGGSRSRDKKRPRKEHCSGVKTYSMCNCGLSRQMRSDPFSLKEANFTFYQKSDLTFGSCCADLDRYDFHLFNVHDAAANWASKSDEDLDTTMVFDDQNPKGPSPSGTKRENEAHFEVDDEENVAIDPHEYNIRFFDDDDEGAAQIPSDEGEGLEMSDQPKGNEAPIEPMTQDDGPMSKAFSGDDIEEDEEVEEQRRKERIESTEEDEELDEEAEELTKQSGDEDEGSSRPMTPTENVDYLENYDLYEQRRGERDSSERGNLSFGRKRNDDMRMLEKCKGLYLEHVPHSKSSPELLPLFPSFSVICIGHSSLYNHSTGIRESPNFRSGSEFLLPWSVQLTVRTEQWLRELQFIGATPTERTFRTLQQQQQRNFERAAIMTSKEKVKLFIGFDYECPRGHRFMVVEPGKVLRHRRMSGTLKTDAAPLMDNDLAIWMPCPCKKEPRMAAQLMRIHIVTPKAPVRVSIQPLIQMPGDDGFFFPGQKERIELGWAKYYVMRLPYVYIGSSGTPFHRPTVPEYRGKLLQRCIQVEYLPLSDV